MTLLENGWVFKMKLTEIIHKNIDPITPKQCIVMNVISFVLMVYIFFKYWVLK